MYIVRRIRYYTDMPYVVCRMWHAGVNAQRRLADEQKQNERATPAPFSVSVLAVPTKKLEVAILHRYIHRYVHRYT